MTQWSGVVASRWARRLSQTQDHYVRDYIAVAEQALGKPLPPGAVVHHHDGDRMNCANTNLVICKDHAYHMVLEARARALRQGGNANLHRCVLCGRYDRQDEMTILRNGRVYRHRSCHAAAMMKYKLAKKTPAPLVHHEPPPQQQTF
jgi:hypothetical protein